jgi:hypothetical protein
LLFGCFLMYLFCFRSALYWFAVFVFTLFHFVLWFCIS